jgi:flagellar biosynthetic protein FliQ
VTTQFVLHLAQSTLWTTIEISAPLLGIGLIVGLLISILQATTQIQEQTLTFIPKIIALGFALALFGPWMLRVLLTFSGGIFGHLNQFVR